MSALTPPPKIERPYPGMLRHEGEKLLADQMERLAAWMYEAARRVEAITNVAAEVDEQERERRRDAKRALLFAVSLQERDGALAPSTAGSLRAYIETLAGDL